MELLDKLLIVELKQKILLIMNGLQYDNIYSKADAYNELNGILYYLDKIESPLTEIME
ncbi:hypothetical protein [Neobacillus vireti]|uniref:hypothetical protein n=1 Tax=Neobacillus vireti TaxID=220686 RepID=UPI0030009987